jgi:hypothetical protein
MFARKLILAAVSSLNMVTRTKVSGASSSCS